MSADPDTTSADAPDAVVRALEDHEHDTVVLCFEDRISIPTSQYDGVGHSRGDAPTTTLVVELGQVDIDGVDLMAFGSLPGGESARIGLPREAANTDTDGRVGVEITAQQEPVTYNTDNADPDTLEWMYPSARIGVEPNEHALQRPSGYSSARHDLGTIRNILEATDDDLEAEA